MREIKPDIKTRFLYSIEHNQMEHQQINELKKEPISLKIW